MTVVTAHFQWHIAFIYCTRSEGTKQPRTSAVKVHKIHQWKHIVCGSVQKWLPRTNWTLVLCLAWQPHPDWPYCLGFPRMWSPVEVKTSNCPWHSKTVTEVKMSKIAWFLCVGMPSHFSMKDLHKVVQRIAFAHEKVGYHLDIQTHVLANIGTDQGSSERKCMDMLRRWRNGERGTGQLPRTWESILHAVGEAVGTEVQKEIEQNISASAQSNRKCTPAEYHIITFVQ